MPTVRTLDPADATPEYLAITRARVILSQHAAKLSRDGNQEAGRALLAVVQDRLYPFEGERIRPEAKAKYGERGRVMSMKHTREDLLRSLGVEKDTYGCGECGSTVLEEMRGREDHYTCAHCESHESYKTIRYVYPPPSAELAVRLMQGYASVLFSNSSWRARVGSGILVHPPSPVGTYWLIYCGRQGNVSGRGNSFPEALESALLAALDAGALPEVE